MEGLRFFLNQGNAFLGLDTEESERWKKAVSPIIDNYVKTMNEKGFNGREVVDYIVSRLKRHMK
jgi:hypothetical protein